MRNLVNIGYKSVDLSEASDLPLSATAWDTATDSIICTFGPTGTSPIIELKRVRHDENLKSEVQRIESITSWDAPCPLPDLVCDEVLSLQYFPDTCSAYVVLAGGDLIVVREDPQPGEDMIEIVGSVDVGISAASWAPDEELLAIVTSGDTLLYMTRGFESVTEVSFSPEDLNASKHVSVGWGKKETQFKGKRAKALRDPTMPESVDEGKLSVYDDRRTTITWRGDGAFVAINSIVSGERRLIRVLTREGVLDSASEPVDGLESSISWRPAGNLIAGIQRQNNHVDVVFFERNGLRHGQFSLRLSNEDLMTWAKSIIVSWNINSTILAVVFLDRVQLWTMGNYHYYLKQEVRSVKDAGAGVISTIRWHPEQSFRLCVPDTTSILALEYIFDVTRGSPVQTDDHGAVAVVDGKSLKLTALKRAGIPPPMSLSEIIVRHNILDAAFSLSCSRIGILTSAGVHIYAWKPDSRQIEAPQELAFIELGKPSENCADRQILYRQEDEIYVLSHTQDSGHRLNRLKAQLGVDPSWSVLPSLSLPEGFITRLVTDLRCQTVWCQYSDKLVTFDPQFEEFHIETSYGPNDLATIQTVNLRSRTEPSSHLNGVSDNEAEFGMLKVGLSSRGELFVNSKLIAKICTSFLVLEAHLLFTTNQHLLKFVHLASVGELEIPNDTPEIDERCRAIERGAKLVTAIPSSYAVVLQMPRGNLETIYPRALVLAGVRQHLDDKDYRAGYLACQNHQVDTNILCDYRSDQFIACIPMVIAQLKKPSRIDDFLSKLRDEDVSLTLYKDTMKPSEPSTSTESGIPKASHKPVTSLPGVSIGKTNRICNEFLSALGADSAGHVQNMITAYVSKRPPDLLSALQLVSKLREESIESADAAIVHLCFLSDVNRLYDAALSLYNIPLTLLVAEQSQKDPREYMPFLEHLHAIAQEPRRRFEIDDYLHNHAKALRALHDLSSHEELEKYCLKHALYTEALALYKHENSPQLRSKILTRLFAEHLVSISRNRQAAILYESLDDYGRAYPLYALSHMWRESLTCAGLASLDADQQRTHATSLASTLADQDRDFRAAATIYSEHVKDHVTAARLLCRGSYFGDASRILALHELNDQISVILDTCLTEKFGEMLELLADCRSQLSAQTPRIEELRVKKSEDPLAFFGGDTNADQSGPGDVPDNVSIAPTDASTTGGQSLFTRYGSSKGAGTVVSTATRKTSKTRRKEERKRAMGKKGSVYEEEYLVASVGRCVERVNVALDELRRLGEGLLRRSMRSRAEVLEDTIKNVLQLSRDSVAMVWTVREDSKYLSGKDNDFSQGGPDRQSGADGVLWDSLNNDVSRPFKNPPPVKEWTSLEGS